MPEFVHRRTGRVVSVADRDAHRYPSDRWERVTPTDAVALTVPDGTVAEILAWAGDNVDRRNAALEAEEKGKRRKGIIDALS